MYLSAFPSPLCHSQLRMVGEIPLFSSWGNTGPGWQFSQPILELRTYTKTGSSQQCPYKTSLEIHAFPFSMKGGHTQCRNWLLWWDTDPSMHIWSSVFSLQQVIVTGPIHISVLVHLSCSNFGLAKITLHYTEAKGKEAKQKCTDTNRMLTAKRNTLSN